MDGSRKPLAKVEGRRRMRLSGVTVAWRGTPNLDDWVAYIANGTRSKKLILADHANPAGAVLVIADEEIPLHRAAIAMAKRQHSRRIRCWSHELFRCAKPLVTQPHPSTREEGLRIRWDHFE